MLNTLQLRTFLTVLETGNFSAAAEKLHLSQSAVSQQIKALEEQLGGVRLFRRSGQRMTPTSVGEELARHARELVGLAERTEQHILGLRGKLTGKLVIGCPAGSAVRWLPVLLALFQSQHDGISLELEVAPLEQLFEGLNSGRIAMFVTEENVRRRGLESTLLAQEVLCLTAPAGHSLLQQAQIPLGMLRSEAFILPRNGSPARRAIEDALRRREIAIGVVSPVLETDDPTATLSALQAGLGLAFIPRSCLPARLEQFGLITLPGPLPQLEWSLVRLRERGTLRANTTLYHFLASPLAQEHLIRLGLQCHSNGVAA